MEPQELSKIFGKDSFSLVEATQLLEARLGRKLYRETLRRWLVARGLIEEGGRMPKIYSPEKLLTLLAQAEITRDGYRSLSEEEFEAFRQKALRELIEQGSAE